MKSCELIHSESTKNGNYNHSGNPVDELDDLWKDMSVELACWKVSVYLAIVFIYLPFICYLYQIRSQYVMMDYLMCLAPLIMVFMPAVMKWFLANTPHRIEHL